MTDRRAPQSPRRVTAIHPVPGWLSALFGEPVARAAAWSSQDGIRIRAASAGGGRALFALSVAADGGLGGARFEASEGARPARVAGDPLASLDETQREHARRFVARLRWLDGYGDGGESRGVYQASDRERRWRRLARSLERVRRVEQVGGVDWTEADARDRGLDAVGVLLDVLGGRWGRVFGRAEHDDAATFEWLDPTLAALSGDWDRLRAQAERARRGVSAGPAANVMGMAFERAGFHDAALAARHEGGDATFGVERGEICVELSKLHLARGDDEDAVLWARRALLSGDPSDDLVGRVCAALTRCGAFDDARAVLEERCAEAPFPPELALSLIELWLRAGRVDRARPLLERVERAAPEGPPSLRRRVARAAAVMHAVEGRWDDAAPIFTRLAEEDPADLEAATWLSEAHLRRDDEAGAERWLERSRARAQTPIHILLRVALRKKPLEEGAEILALVETLGEPKAPWYDPDHRGRRARALALLSTFGGDRRAPLSRRVSSAGGSLGVERVTLPRSSSVLSSRDAAADTLEQLGRVPPDVVEERFEALARRFPGSPHPLCYWGELALWLGRYDQAMALFDEALERHVARWAFVGKAAVHLLRGEHDAADAQIAECHREFDPLVGATTHVYVGEAKRRRGAYAEAIEHLALAVRVKPGRAGAWMNLALAYRAQGEAEEAARIVDMLEARYPRLYWDAWHALSGEPAWPVPRTDVEALFEKALEMMRGNRSSHLITYFDAGGTFRRLPRADRWLEPLARHAPFVAEDLRRRVAVGIERGP